MISLHIFMLRETTVSILYSFFSFIAHESFIFIYETIKCKLSKGKIITKEKAQIVINIFILYFLYQLMWKRKWIKQWGKLIFKANIRICFKTLKYSTYTNPYCIADHKNCQIINVMLRLLFKVPGLEKTKKSIKLTSLSGKVLSLHSS